MSRDPIAKMTGQSSANPDHLWDMRLAAWHKLGLPLLPPDEIKSDIDREYIKRVAEDMYGPRKSNSGLNNGGKDATGSLA